VSETSCKTHWNSVYVSKGEDGVSWFQASAAPSLDLIARTGATPRDSVIDIGGGASRLVDALLARGFVRLTVLDLSEEALMIAKARLGEDAARVNWIVSDVTRWEPAETYDLWHDRAAFHFLTEEADRAAYTARLARALRPGGHAVIATFALDGPERCSGLPVLRQDAAGLSAMLGSGFALVETRPHEHRTPWDALQRFQFSLFRRR
jgi:SAM-dependent methyltransferase